VFRAFVSFLVALPLLMPPGMCVCRFAPATATAVETAGRTDACVAGEHGCCGHRHIVNKPTADEGSHSISARFSVPTAEEHGPTQPNQPHEPGCPALQTSDHVKRAEQNHVSVALCVRLSTSGVVEDFKPLTSSVVANHATVQASLPLYLSFRTLLI
jgi:hypothetical protein